MNNKSRNVARLLLYPGQTQSVVCHVKCFSDINFKYQAINNALLYISGPRVGRPLWHLRVYSGQEECRLTGGNSVGVRTFNAMTSPSLVFVFFFVYNRCYSNNSTGHYLENSSSICIAGRGVYFCNNTPG